MKYLPCYLFLALPLTAFSQESPTAIIVEEDEEFSESDFNLPAVADEVADDQNLEDLMPSESTDELDESEESSPLGDEILPVQPEDLRLAEPEESVVVKVEILKQIELSKDTASGFKLISPWAPKPMQLAPVGWRYTPAQRDKAYPVEVKLSTGKTLDLSVTPYTLVPEESNKVVQAREPGYQPERGYQQVHSISARLKTTTDNLKQAGDSLDQSIENLSALVDSLPK